MGSLTFADPLILDSISEHRGTIIMLHGRGSTGPEFAQDLFESQLSTGLNLRDLLPDYKWIFPTCPLRYAAAFREEITQWYEISSLTDPDVQQENQFDGIRTALEYVSNLVTQEAKDSPTGNVILGGISQGFSIAILAALISTESLRALIGFASWLPQYSKIYETILEGGDQCSQRAKISQKLRDAFMLNYEETLTTQALPIFLAHCSDDPVVDVLHGSQTRDLLIRIAHKVTWLETKNGGHWINEPEAMDGLGIFLREEGLITG